MYLSDSKLRQFLPEGRWRSRLGRRLNMLRLDVDTPVGGGGIEVALGGEQTVPEGNAQHLAAVIKYVEERALWFQDPAARSGHWVYFEAPLYFFLVDSREPDIGTVLFYDSPAVEGYDPGGTRLLLHGSPRHLLASVSKSGLASSEVIGSIYAGGTCRSSRLWDNETPPEAPTAERISQDPEPPQRGLSISTIDSMGQAVGSMRSIDHRASDGAAWMRGYARVSVVHEGVGAIVIATPLYVEYAHDLPN
ncbi:SAVMC3_10250 family protein [Streptomyces sp. GTA36]